MSDEKPGESSVKPYNLRPQSLVIGKRPIQEETPRFSDVRH